MKEDDVLTFSVRLSACGENLVQKYFWKGDGRKFLFFHELSALSGLIGSLLSRAISILFYFAEVEVLGKQWGGFYGDDFGEKLDILPRKLPYGRAAA